MEHYYRRHLPHEVPDDVPIFVTWNLKGAMPAAAIARLRGERERLERQPARSGELPRDRRIRESKILFGMADKVLDAATEGPLHLKDPRAAKIVEDSIFFGVVGQAFQPDSGPTGQPGKAELQPAFREGPKRYDLFAWCVMANHVHVLLKPVWELKEVMQGIKGYTAYEINGLQEARGRVFWQDESFDHWVRDEEELIRIIDYIENNPVKAGLCARPEDWPWSSARFRIHWPVGQPFQADATRSVRRMATDVGGRQAGKPDLRGSAFPG
jgi:putative transposase